MSDPSEPTYRERAVAFAEDALGVQEHPRGSNTGPEVDGYLAEVGLPPGNPWCMAAAYHFQKHAALHAGVPVPIPATGLCAALYAWAVKSGKLTKTPRPADIGLRKGGPRGHDHAVTVTARVPGNLVTAIAGNTSLDGESREGYIVARHTYAMEDLDFVSVSDETS